MERQLPPLNALRAFDIAARAANFTEAAKQLHVSQGAISRHISQLEAFLGIQLFQRGHREVRLTSEGTEFALAIRNAFDRIEQATRWQMQARRNRPLRIKLFPTLATKWLAPRLGRFHSLHPTIDVQLTTTLNHVRLEIEETDVTIQIQLDDTPGVHQESLFAIDLVPVCSPAYLARSKPIHRPEDLLQHALLHSMKRPDDWQIWFAAAGIRPHAVHAGLSFGNSVLAYLAAVEGAGIAMGHTQMIGDDIAHGRLTAAFPLVAESGDSYRLTVRQSDLARKDMAAFRSWVMDEAKSANDAFSIDGGFTSISLSGATTTS
jgi:LysR family transcriptional regulator, glycine cleavage system transcriptional activator